MVGERRVAVITGGSSGIGLATGAELVGRGYDVVLTARTEERLRDAATGIGARWHAADAADPDAFDGVVAEAGRVDLLVHAAGVMAGTFVRKETLEAFESVLRTNLTSAFVAARACLGSMEAGGRMIFLSSSSSHEPQPGRSAYSASKAGLNAFAGALAREVGRDGVSVHVVTTGPVDTPMLDDVRFPMHALATDDVVGAIAWLDTLPPHVELPELVVSATTSGPFAPAPLVPPAAAALGRTANPSGGSEQPG